MLERICLLQQLNAADDGQGLLFVLDGGNKTQNGKHQNDQTGQTGDKADERNGGQNAAQHTGQSQNQRLIQMKFGTLTVAGQIGDQPADDADVSDNTRYLFKYDFSFSMG